MKLYILRHGDAGEPGDPRYKESERPLTPKGTQRTKQLTHALRQMDVAFDVILSSPLMRARQTAEIVARGAQFEGKLEFTEQLAPGGSMQKLVEQINAIHPAPGSVLLSGHEPYLSGFISLLCVGGPELPLKLKKGALCRLDVDRLSCGKCATLEWLLQPRLFSAKPGKEERAKE
jgi:phosphohistidine phosphatase